MESKFYKERNIIVYDMLKPLSIFYIKMEYIQDLLNYIY